MTMKRPLLFAASAVFAMTAMGQAWTGTDINGNTWSIQDLLDDGKTVLVDVSAHWCGPCWAWHQSGIMEKIYEEFGPDGTNDVMIFFVDGDATSTLAELQGVGSTQGDWTAGTPYPIIGPNGAGGAIRQQYGTTAYPTLYIHCPGSTQGVEIDREATWEVFMDSWRQMCGAPFINGSNDATLLGEHGTSEVCPGEGPVVDLMNVGSSNLTSATIELKQGGTTVETINWTGNLASYDYEMVQFTQAISGPVMYDFVVSSPNGGADANPLGNEENKSFALAPDVMTNVTLELRTDNYGSETSWKLYNSSNTVVQQSSQTYANATTYNFDWMLNANECYRFEILDSYGDGICCSYGNGYFKIKETGTSNVYIQGGQFGGKDERRMNALVNASVAENTLDNTLSVYPNPTEGELNLSFTLTEGGQVSVDVFNVLGERVLSNGRNYAAGAQREVVDLGTLTNGVYYVNITANAFQATRKVTVNK